MSKWERSVRIAGEHPHHRHRTSCTYDGMKQLIVVPLQIEFDPFLRHCIEYGCEIRHTQLGRLSAVELPDLEITLACGGLGKVQFAVQTQHLLSIIEDWDLVICAGAAGALVDDLEIGDVVAATTTVEHDIRNRFGPPVLPSFAGAADVLDDLQNMARRGLYRVHFGPIASGDEDVIDPERRRTLYDRTGALAVAWEGAGGARACVFSGVPFVEIRGVTDAANQHAPADFERNCAVAMGNVASLILDWVRYKRRPQATKGAY